MNPVSDDSNCDVILAADCGMQAGNDAFTELAADEMVVGVESAILGSEEYNLAFGLDANLDMFAAATNSQTYVQRAGSTLFVPEKATAMAGNATEINFNLEGFSWSRYLNWRAVGSPELPHNATNMELNMIVENSEFLNKTNFYVYR